MKKHNLIFAAIVILFISSCKENKKQEQSKSVTNENIKTKNELTYLYANNRDTILLALENVENTILGRLDILPYEKDSRCGTIKNGQFKGDTLFAIYNSIQEGQESECEIAFLKKDNSYIISNDIFEESNYQYNSNYTKGSFKNKNIIKFNGETLKIITKK